MLGTKPLEQLCILPTKALLRVCRCNALVVGMNACPHCGAGWAEAQTSMTEYSSAELVTVVCKEERGAAFRNAVNALKLLDRRDGPKGTDWIREGQDSAYRQGIDACIAEIELLKGE